MRSYQLADAETINTTGSSTRLTTELTTRRQLQALLSAALRHRSDGRHKT